MAKAEQTETPTTLTTARASRLFKLLNLLEGSTRARATLLKRLDFDLRSFYRDIEVMREFGIEITVQGDKYTLATSLTDALQKLPFPDPGLSFADVMEMSKDQNLPVQKKLRSRLHQITKAGQ